jgi:hypothetical protein
MPSEAAAPILACLELQPRVDPPLRHRLRRFLSHSRCNGPVGDFTATTYKPRGPLFSPPRRTIVAQGGVWCVRKLNTPAALTAPTAPKHIQGVHHVALPAVCTMLSNHRRHHSNGLSIILGSFPLIESEENSVLDPIFINKIKQQ